MPYCGGNYGNGANAGVFYCNANNARSNSNANLGFRSALATMFYRQKLQTHAVCSQHKVAKGSYPHGSCQKI